MSEIVAISESTPRLPVERLSKTKFIAGVQCAKLLWHHLNAPQEIPALNAATHSARQSLDILARDLFPGGVEISGDPADLDHVCICTQITLAERKPVYGGAFAADGLFARADILDPVETDSWDLFEINSTTELKTENLWDVGFQAYVLASAGLILRRCCVVHLNKNYVKSGGIDPGRFFVIEDVTVQVQRMSSEIQEKINILSAQARKKLCPDVAIGPHCNRPFQCPLICRCWEFLGEDSVLSLYRGGSKAWTLLRQGIVRMEDISDNVPLTKRQAIQVKARRSGQAHVHREALRRFLEKLKFPLYFLDFETVNPAVPLWENSKPFEQVPFQLSLHILENWSTTAHHHQYLSEGRNDPRKHIIKYLAELIRPNGSIIAYNARFEIEVLNRCSILFPEHLPWWESTRGRFIDLLQPFRDFDYYAPRQHGSASMKSVLPALCNVGYGDLTIQDGTSASQAFLMSTLDSVNPEEKNRIRKDLEAYCGRDTEGMIFILRELKRLAES